jgi:multiple RNA-binding domain-containing protein 1
MQAPTKSKSWRDTAVEDHETTSPSISRPSKTDQDIGDDSEEDYQAIIKPAKRQKEDCSKSVEDGTKHTRDVDVFEASEQHLERNADDVARRDEAEPAQSDTDWLRSRTSRLLGLLDEDEEEQYMSKQNDENTSKSPIQQTMNSEPQQASEIASDEAPSPEKQQEDDTPVNADEQAIRKSKRLFLRNLPYSVTEDDLREQFEPFGDLEEVRSTLCFMICFSFSNDDS